MTRVVPPRAAALSLALPLLAAPSFAHERWVRHELKSEFDRSLFESAGPINLGTAVAIVLLAAAVTAGSAAIRARSRAEPRWVPPLRPWAPTVLGITYGLGLVLFGLSGQYMAPDLVQAGVEGRALVLAALVSGVLIALGAWTRPAAWLSLLLYGWALARRPFLPFDGAPVSAFAVLNYLEVAGVSLYLALQGRGALSIDGWRSAVPRAPAAHHALAVGLLRVLFGGTLLILGLQKFLLPELPMGVVQNYADKIYEPIAAWTGVSPEAYVFAASAVESSVGLLVLLGGFTRVLMVVLALLFLLTAILFKSEVFGHLPLFGIVLSLLIEGAGAGRADSLLRRSTPAVRAGLRGAGATLAGMVAVIGLAASWTGCSKPAGSVSTLVASSQPGLSGTGERGLYRFELTLEPELPELSRFFSVRTNVTSARTGEAVPGELKLSASMPEHGHGMITLPRTHAVSEGRYSTVGCKLHMFGSWVFEFELEGPEGRDRAALEYDYSPPAVRAAGR